MLASGYLFRVSVRFLAQKLVFLGSPEEGLALQSRQKLTVDCVEGFLGNAKNNR